MSEADDPVVQTLFGQLDADELAAGVVYLAAEVFTAGAQIELPRLSLSAPWEARLAFVDREPMANWTHGCRYLLLSVATDEVVSAEAELPPFGSTAAHGWQVVHKPDGVPDEVLPDLR